MLSVVVLDEIVTRSTWDKEAAWELLRRTMAKLPPKPPVLPVAVTAQGRPRDLRGHAAGRAVARIELTTQRRRRGRPKQKGMGGFESDADALRQINAKYDEVTEDEKRPALRKEVASEFGMDPTTLWRAMRHHHLVNWPPEPGPGFVK